MGTFWRLHADLWQPISLGILSFSTIVTTSQHRLIFE